PGPPRSARAFRAGADAFPGLSFGRQLEGRSDMKLGAPLFERVQAAARAVSEQLEIDTPTAAIVLGSGLGGVADRLSDARRGPYASLPCSPETTVAGHPGRLVAGKIPGTIAGAGGDKTVLLLCGRVHGYEGYPPSEVGFGVR